MFTFINAYVLSFLFVVLVPLLIHLFNKKRKKRIKYSSIRFLKLLEKQRLKRIKLYEYLLILLRTLIILVLVIAFARPTLMNRSFFSNQGARTTSVIIVDSGINMRGYDELGNRFKRSADRLKTLLESFSPQDQFFVIQTTKPTEILTNPPHTHGSNAAFIPGHWESTFEEAKILFAENPNFNQELFIISDFQFQNNNFLEFIKTFENQQIYFLKIGLNPIINIGIDTVEIKNRIFEMNKPVNINVHLKSSGPVKTEPVEVHLFVNDQRVSHNRISLNESEKKVIPLTFQPKESGLINCYIEISDDDLLSDNRYYFAIRIPSEIKTLFVDDNPSVYLKAAFSSLSEKANIQIVSEKYSSWARQNFQQYDIIFISNFSRLSNPIISRLKRYLDFGRSVILMPGLNTLPVEFNKDISLLGVSSKIVQIVQSDNKNDFFLLKEPDLNHPLFSGLFRLNSPQLSNPKFYRYFKFNSNPDDQIILSYQNKDPFIFKTKSRKSSVYIFSSYIDDDWTDIQYRGLFLPLLSKLLHLGISNNLLIQPSVYAESPKTVSVNLVSESSEFFLLQPNGEKNSVIPTPVNQLYQFHITPLNSPGIYQLLAEKKVISTIPVNANTQTLNEPFVELNRFGELENVRIFDEGAVIKKSILEARFGSELWRMFIGLALILLLIEIYFIKKMEGKKY